MSRPIPPTLPEAYSTNDSCILKSDEMTAEKFQELFDLSITYIESYNNILTD